MSKAKEILEGWTNYVMGDDNVVLKLAKKRADICAVCPLATHSIGLSVLPDYSFGEIQGFYCSKEKGGCGCPISPMIRARSKKCPLGKW